MPPKPDKPKKPKRPKLTKPEEAQKCLEEAYEALYDIPSGDAMEAGASELIAEVMSDLLPVMAKMDELAMMFEDKLPEPVEPDPGV